MLDRSQNRPCPGTGTTEVGGPHTFAPIVKFVPYETESLETANYGNEGPLVPYRLNRKARRAMKARKR